MLTIIAGTNRPSVLHRSRFFSAICLICVGFALAAASLYAATNHPPKISWIPSQQITNNATSFNKVYLSVWDDDGSNLQVSVFSVKNSLENLNFYTGQINKQPCTQSGDSQCPAFDISARPGHVVDERWILHKLRPSLNPKEQDQISAAIASLVTDGLIEIKPGMGMQVMALTQKGYDAIY